jgi:hypothetical protein
MSRDDAPAETIPDATGRDAAYQLLLQLDEVPVAATAVRLFISDEAHQPRVHQLGREILGALERSPEERGTLTMSLDAEQMKIMYSAVRLLLDDRQHDQASDREILRSILNKLPGDHTIRAIELDHREVPDAADHHERENAHQQLITDGEVRQIVHALAPFGILDHHALSRQCDHAGWQEGGFTTALHKAVSSGVIEELPGGFYTLVQR